MATFLAEWDLFTMKLTLIDRRLREEHCGFEDAWNSQRSAGGQER